MTAPAIALREITTNVRRTAILAWILLGFIVMCGVMAFALHPRTIKPELPGGWAVTDNPFAAWINALLTASLVLIYLGSVVLFQQRFGRVTGQHSTLAIVLSTLRMAALFNPLRRRTQRLIEHGFYRRRYNAERVLERSAVASRNEVNLGALEVVLAAVVRETMLPASISICINRSRE